MNSFNKSNNFSGVFSRWIYEKKQSSSISLDIWKDFNIKIPQESKYSSIIFSEYKVIATDFSVEIIANKLYSQASLWWTILVANNEDDPFDFLQNVREENSKYKNSNIKVFSATGISKLMSDLNVDVNINTILQENK
jgi:hypothetical protein